MTEQMPNPNLTLSEEDWAFVKGEFPRFLEGAKERFALWEDEDGVKGLYHNTHTDAEGLHHDFIFYDARHANYAMTVYRLQPDSKQMHVYRGTLAEPDINLEEVQFQYEPGGGLPTSDEVALVAGFITQRRDEKRLFDSLNIDTDHEDN